jgi:hypothetical protein
MPQYAHDGTVAGFTITFFPDAALERRRQRRTATAAATPATASGDTAFGPALIAAAHDA